MIWGWHRQARELVPWALNSLQGQNSPALEPRSKAPFQRALIKYLLWTEKGFPCGSAAKEYACNAGDLGLIPGLGRTPGEGNGYPLQYSGLENSIDRGAWQATVHGVAKSQTGLRDFHFHWPYGSSGNCLFYHSNSSFFGSCSWSSLLKTGLCFPYALQIGIQPST